LESFARNDARVKTIRSVILPLFLVSGATGLIYEVTWTRSFGVVFGNTVFAVSTVLTAFMLGLAIGSWLFGKAADRSRNPLGLYAVLELLIGVYAFAFPAILKTTDLFYIWLFRSYEPGFYSLSIVRFIISVVIVSLPTVLMGGTLPVLCRLWVAPSSRDSLHEQTGRSVGFLYAINTFGAVAGSFLAGYFLIRLLGVSTTVYVAAVANVVIGVTAMVLSRLIRRYGAYDKKAAGVRRPKAQPEHPEPVAAGGIEPAATRGLIVLSAIAVSGFCALALEVLWTRVLVFVLGTSVYAFTCMLTCFIFGIAVGSVVCSRFLVTKIKNPVFALGIIELLIAIFVLGSVPLLASLWHIDFVFISEVVGTRTSFARDIVAHFLDTLVVVLVPTALMGMVFPIAVKAFAPSLQAIGRKVGQVYASNTIGCVVGSFIAGFVMIPFLGLRDSFILVITIQFLLASVLTLLAEKHRLLLGIPSVILSAVVIVGALAKMPRDIFVRTMNTYHYPSKIVFIKDDATGTITVHDLPDGDRFIAADGVDVAGVDLMLRTTQKLQGYVPLILHENPRDVLQIGFGSGETCGIGLAFGGEDFRYSIVEICPGVFEAGQYFEQINRGSYKNPKLRKIIMDGKNFVKLTNEMFDIIMNDSTYPGTTGSSALYTYDHFMQCRKHLNPGGVLSCWLPIDLRPEDLQVIVKSFQAAMPNCSLWMANNCLNKHAVLVGTLSPMRIDFQRVKKVVERPDIATDLAEINIHSIYDFLDCFVVGENGIRTIAADSPLNTDDKPYLEFGAAINRDVEGCWLAVLEMIAGNHRSVADYVVNTGQTPEQSQQVKATLQQYFLGTNHALKGLVGMLEGNPETMTTEFELARKANPLDRDIDSCIKEMNDEINALRQAIERTPKSAPLRSRLAKRYMLSGDYQHAIDQYQAFLRLNPDNAAAWNNVGVCHRRLKQFDKAVEAFNNAIQYDRELVQPCRNLSEIYEQLGDPKAVCKSLEKAIPLSSDSRKIYIYVTLSRAYYIQNEYGPAITCLDKALELAPQGSDIWQYIQGQRRRVKQVVDGQAKP